MGDLADELRAAIESSGAEFSSGDAGASADTGTDTGTTAAPVDNGSTDTGIARDEFGRFAGKSAATEQPADGAQAAAPTDPAQAAPAAPTEGQQASPEAQQAAAEGRAPSAPPATWSAGAKAVFAELPEVARREIAKRERDYAVGIQQHAERAKGYDTLMAEFQPYEPMLRAEGSNPQVAVRSLLNTAYVLRTAPPQQKAELIMNLAQQFGADLSPYFAQSGQQGEGAQPDPLQHVEQYVQQLVSPHLQKIQQWEQGQASAQQHAAQQQEQEIQSQIVAFQSATNEDGSPKHLYFENVRPLMSAYFANGQAKDLEQAYEMACWANPEVRAALQAEQQRSADAKRLEEARRKAADAGNAGFNVSGQGGVGIASTTHASLEDELRANLRAAAGGGRV